VAAVDEGCALGQLPLLAERIAVVAGDGGVLVLPGDRAGRVEQR
jgi:hypothetical protein